MARLLIDAIWLSQALGILSDIARIVYVTLLLMTDTAGNGTADCARIKCNAYAYRDDIRLDDIRSSLNELDGAGIIQLYTVDGAQYYHVAGFENSQRFRWSKHLVPLPDGTPPDVANARERRAASRGKASTSSSTSEDEVEREKEVDFDADAEEETKPMRAESGETQKSPFALPLKGSGMYIPTPDDIEWLQKKYSSRDLQNEFALMRNWLQKHNNPLRSDNQVNDFIQKWLLRAGNITQFSGKKESESSEYGRNAWMNDYD